MAGGNIEYCCVITDTERDVRTLDRLTREVLGDEIEFVQVIFFTTDEHRSKSD